MSVDVKTLDFSGLKDYEECPQRYYWHRLLKKKPIAPENFYYAISGIVKQKLFELMFNEMWYLKGKECAPYMESQAERVFNETLMWARVDWNFKYAKLNKAQMLDEIKDGVRKGIKLIKEHRLISPKSKSEVKLTAPVNNWFTLVGKVDFIIKHEKENYIVDGKDTADVAKMKTNVDNRQLLIYSHLHKENYGFYPSKLGFLFWRHDTVDYIDPQQGIEEVLELTKKTFWNIKNGKFEATPSSKVCFFCKYKQECPAARSLDKPFDDGSGVESGEISF